MRKQVVLVGAALLLTAAAFEASAAPCGSTTTYADFVPCSVENVMFNNVSVGISQPIEQAIVERISPFDDGTYFGLSFSYSDFSLASFDFIMSFIAATTAGFRTTTAL